MKLGTFYTPPKNKGQIVEVSYTQVDGMVIRRVCDASDRTTEYAIAQANENDEGDYWNVEPNPADDWKPITADQARWFKNEFGLEFR